MKKDFDVNIFKGVLDELKKVSWPSRSQGLHLTAVVVIISISIGLYVGLLDSIFTFLLKLIINL